MAKNVNELDITIIGNGIDRIRKNSGKAAYALFIGRLEMDQKGLDLLLHAWQKVEGKLIIAGDGKDSIKIKGLIEKLSLQNKVETIGWVAGKEKQKLFKDAAFVVIPSRFETYSLTSLEAFSYGLPVVAFDIEGLKWMPNGSGIKVTPFNVASYSKACNKLFTDSKRRKEMGITGEVYAKNFTWESISKKYQDYIFKVLK